MLYLGIDRNSRLVYEGQGYVGHGVWPTPPLSNAKFVVQHPSSEHEQSNSELFFFREDSFDPVTRVRRGRFYVEGNKQPERWHVQPHPAITSELKSTQDGLLTRDLDTFYGQPIWYRFCDNLRSRPLVLLGTDDRFTSWYIIDVEAIHTGEDLVTLKACSHLGILPDLIPQKIPENHISIVNETLNAVAEELHKSSPMSVVDRTREAISAVFLAHYKTTTETARDLSFLIKKIEKDGYILPASAAKIVARLHARVKPVERQKRSLPPVSTQDAELSVRCLSLVLCELGFARWP